MQEQFDALVKVLLDSGFFLEEAVEMLERKLVQGALQRAGGNQSEASKALGIHRNTIQRKMLEYHLEGRRVRRKPLARTVRKVARTSNAS